MKQFICRKSHLCGQSAEVCLHAILHDNGDSCEFSYCEIIRKDVSCGKIEEEIKEEVKK
jgi:hypothetical protein